MAKKTEKLKEEIEDLNQKWKRALADYQNLERRTSQEREALVKFTNAGLIAKILSALDCLEMAEAHLKDEGLSLALKQLRQVLEEEGLEKIEVLGKPFNPQEMECVELIGGKEGIVEQEARKGYKLNGKVLRCAQVRAGKEREN